MIQSVFTDKNKQQEIANQMKQIGPQIPALMATAQAVLSGEKTDSPIVGAIQEMLDPKTPTGKLAQKLLDNGGKGGGSDDFETYVNTRLSSFETRISKLEGKVELLLRLMDKRNNNAELTTTERREKREAENRRKAAGGSVD
jgi:hypothetical protein